jgi:dehydro coenzyme F420 reductase / coenzyme F420-0:L-glutamate ligase / coenzyme F420-1:gamma-L-glutamate ligase
VKVEIVPVRGLPEVRQGDDLVALIWAAIQGFSPRLVDEDIVVVTQKIVSKAEGRMVPERPEGKAGWVARESRRVVARRGDLVIAETRHGFVCANSGVDASNVAEGFLTLLPEDPDGSAERIRTGLERATGARIGVVVTDTFGRPWRNGLVNVAIGCAGLPALIDLRGTKDATGRTLEMTVVALADEVAAASSLVMGKADGVPVAVVRGLHTEEPPSPASVLVRTGRGDLFPESPLQSIHASGPVGAFGPGDVPMEAVRQAVLAALAGGGPDAVRPWAFVAVGSDPARQRLLAALEVEATGLTGATVLVVPCARFDADSLAAGAGHAERERDRTLLSAGMAVQRLVLALHAQGLAWRRVSPPGTREGTVADAIGLADGWVPLGVIAVGGPADEGPAGQAATNPAGDLDAVLRELS